MIFRNDLVISRPRIWVNSNQIRTCIPCQIIFIIEQSGLHYDRLSSPENASNGGFISSWLSIRVNEDFVYSSIIPLQIMVKPVRSLIIERSPDVFIMNDGIRK